MDNQGKEYFQVTSNQQISNERSFSVVAEVHVKTDVNITPSAIAQKGK